VVGCRHLSLSASIALQACIVDVSINVFSFDEFQWGGEEHTACMSSASAVARNWKRTMWMIAIVRGLFRCYVLFFQNDLQSFCSFSTFKDFMNCALGKYS